MTGLSMNKLTPKRMLLLSGLFLVGCCQDYAYIPDDVIMEQVPRGEYYNDSRNDARQIITKKHPDVYVVNNTPHIRKQEMPSNFRERHNDKEIGLVSMDGKEL